MANKSTCHMTNEKRLIDAKKLPYTIAVDDNGRQIFYVKAEAIDEAPTIYAVEVVRCKDCIQWERFKSPAICHHGRCHTHDIEMDEDDYCSYGERKAEDGNTRR